MILLAALLAAGGESNKVFAYPEPPTSADEERLFALIACNAYARLLLKWMEER